MQSRQKLAKNLLVFQCIKNWKYLKDLSFASIIVMNCMLVYGIFRNQYLGIAIDFKLPKDSSYLPTDA